MKKNSLEALYFYFKKKKKKGLELCPALKMLISLFGITQNGE